MVKYVTALIFLATITGFIFLFVKALKSKNLWLKIMLLVFAVISFSIAGLFCIPIVEFNATSIDAKVIGSEYVSEYEYKVKCEYTYKNKTYRADVEGSFYDEPEIGSKIKVKVNKDKPDKVKGGDRYPGGVGLLFVFCIIGIFIFGGIGLVIFIPSLISIIIFCVNKNKRNPDYIIQK